MPFLRLDGIGKIYVSEGAISVGIRGVSLEFERGEFVAVTGKSGSGKSTLLNAISGIDTYEEGELYVEGEPTSHYRQPEWEKYREKYISFIFQDYNIIDSFTVLQNVELALMHIDSKRERRRRALELIDRVGLTKQKGQKGSMLSGGQKQRTVIARALAKDSPMILADEPCGNLDSETSRQIIELLYEVSRDKLLIMVTHNAEEVEGYATRHIRVFDGRIESDVRSEQRNITEPINAIEGEDNATRVAVSRENDNKSGFARGLGRVTSALKKGLSLGLAIFTSKPRLTSFLCMLSVIASLGMTVMASSTSEAIAEMLKRPTMFAPIDGRLVLSRRDGEAMSEEELASLAKKYGAESHLRYDFLLEAKGEQNDILDVLGDYYYEENTLTLYTEKGYTDIDATFRYDEDYGRVTGRYPEEIGEALLRLPISYLSGSSEEELLDSYLTYGAAPLKVVGLSFYADNNIPPTCLLSKEGYIQLALLSRIPQYNSYLQFYIYDGQSTTVTSMSDFGIEWGRSGIAILDKTLKAALDNRSQDATVSGLFTAEKYSYYGGVTSYMIELDGDDLYDGADVHPAYGLRYFEPSFIIGSETLIEAVEQSYGASYNQGSLFFSSDKEAEEAIAGLKAEGYSCILSTYKYSPDAMSTLTALISGAVMTAALALTVIFLAFFIYVCSLKALSATASEVAIMRSMGIPSSVIRIGMYARMALCFVPGALAALGVGALVGLVPAVNKLFSYLYLWQYLPVLVCIFAISAIVTSRQMAKIFNQSVKTTLRGGDKA